MVIKWVKIETEDDLPDEREEVLLYDHVCNERFVGFLSRHNVENKLMFYCHQNQERWEIREISHWSLILPTPSAIRGS